MLFTPEHLDSLLAECGTNQPNGQARLWIAYSGGVDSHVLVDYLTNITINNNKLHGVIHVNHHLCKEADSWAKHCQKIATQYDLECVVLDVDAAAASGESPENAAREARYTAIAGFIQPGDVVCLAQHQQDQAETFLYQALRGAGPHGLSAMPVTRPLGNGYLIRPMLGTDKQLILDYAQQHQLNWIEDDSNQDTQLDRNYLRHEILPRLKDRWPAVSRTLSRAARHTAHQTQVMDEMLAEQLHDLRGSHAHTLSISRLLEQPESRAALLVRAHIRKLGLALPGTQQLYELLQVQLAGEQSAEMQVNWPGVEVRRYQDDLYFMPPQVPTPCEGWRHNWDITTACEVSECHGTLSARPQQGQGLAARYCEQPLLVRGREGGERCQPSGRQHHYDLKRLFQEQQIPPWERPRLPLIYVDQSLAAVADLWVCQEFAAAENEPGYVIGWQPQPD